MTASHSDHSYSDHAVHAVHGGHDIHGYQDLHQHDNNEEALSPSDGYFRGSQFSPSSHRHGEASHPGVPSVPNVLVEDPSASAAAHSKPLPDPHHRHHHHNHHRQPDAPPAYAPANPSTPRSPYQTFPDSPARRSDSSESRIGFVPEEQRRLLSFPWEPESMSGGVPGDYGARRRRWLQWLTWRNVRRKVTTILGVLVIISIIAVILQVSLGFSEEEQPGFLDPPSGDLVWSPSKQCGVNSHRLPKLNSRVDFSAGRNLSILQDIRSSLGRQPRVSGKLILVPTAHGDESSGEVEVEILSNYREGDASVAASIISHDEETQAFTVTVPPSAVWDWTFSPCMQIRIAVRVSPDAVLDTLDVRLAHLNVILLPGLALNTSDVITIATTAGHVKAPTTPETKGEDAYDLGSRRIDISTVSGNVAGWYPLYDLLRIRTQSGSINVDVGHKPAARDDPDAAATLQFTTSSGSISASAAGLDFPPRDYVTTIKALSGQITANLPFSSQGRFESVNGQLHLTLHPVLLPDTGAKLVTSSTNGQTNVALKDPQWVRGQSSRALSNLRSDHDSVSGGMTLRYPASWEGTFRAEAVSGTQSFRGDGLHVHKEYGLVGHVLEGYKGEGDSYLNVYSVSGNQNFVVG